MRTWKFTVVVTRAVRHGQLAVPVYGQRSIEVHAPSWFAARDAAARSLGVPRDAVQDVPVDTAAAA